MSKLTAYQATDAVLAELRPHVLHMMLLAHRGQPIEAASKDTRDVLDSEVTRRSSDVLESPYSNVSAEAWVEAHESAADRIYEREGVEREPTHEETDAEWERLRHARIDSGRCAS